MINHPWGPWKKVTEGLSFASINRGSRIKLEAGAHICSLIEGNVTAVKVHHGVCPCDVDSTSLVYQKSVLSDNGENQAPTGIVQKYKLGSLVLLTLCHL